MDSSNIRNHNEEEKEVLNNLGLVKSIAARFIGRGVDFDDLVQIGSIGLIKAVRQFDPSRENAFSTYAVPLIMGEIRRYFRDNGPIKISRKIQGELRTIQKYTDEYEKQHGHEPIVDDIVTGTGISYEDVILAMNATAAPISLTPIDEDMEEMAIQDKNAQSPLHALEFYDVINMLEQTEQLLIYLRFIKGLTQTQVAKVLHSTQVKISRLEKKIKQKLKQELE
ncbi:MAG TPA: RNA polymerase sigma-F factor [Clostridiales bacterium]|jgi:RNA polymerase sporulation-specific sigma factor|nr:RNA polymerase sigma-F factor [Clostridiales bacterium]